jgi:hypothetical protein
MPLSEKHTKRGKKKITLEEEACLWLCAVRVWSQEETRRARQRERGGGGPHKNKGRRKKHFPTGISFLTNA